MAEIQWKTIPPATHDALITRWVRIQCNLGLAQNTVDAYTRALNEFAQFSVDAKFSLLSATREHIALYIRSLLDRPRVRPQMASSSPPSAGLSNATIHQRLTALRLFFDFLIEEGCREKNPIGRGQYTATRGFGIPGARGLIPRVKKFPRIPTEAEWQTIVAAVREEPVRNRFMFALNYDAALRREELCTLQSTDLDPAHRTVRIRAEHTKMRRERIVPYSATTAQLLHAYLLQRRSLSTARGPLFLSESHRNKGQGLSKWAWSKIVRRIAQRSQIDHLTTHTARHLCLTDLARDGWALYDIATFAGHRSLHTTLIYIHLSGRDLAEKLAAGMATIHARRLRDMDSLSHGER